MQNLDQKRALNAMVAVRKYNPQGKNEGNVIKKVPTMIQQNGLLGAIAFALDDKTVSGITTVGRLRPDLDPALAGKQG